MAAVNSKGVEEVPTPVAELEFGLVVKTEAVSLEAVSAAIKSPKRNWFFEIEDANYERDRMSKADAKMTEPLTRALRDKSRASSKEDMEALEARINEMLAEGDREMPEGYVQMCVKCNEAEAEPPFILDREFGYCGVCADLLQLGKSKDANSFKITINDSDADEEDEEDAAY